MVSPAGRTDIFGDGKQVADRNLFGVLGGGSREEWTISEDEMGGKCSMYVRDGTRMKFLVRKLKERVYF